MNKNCDTELAIARLTETPLREFSRNGHGYGFHGGEGRGYGSGDDFGNGNGCGYDFVYGYGDYCKFGYVVGYGNRKGGCQQRR